MLQYEAVWPTGGYWLARNPLIWALNGNGAQWTLRSLAIISTFNTVLASVEIKTTQ
jgi:hypothetical protein